MAIIGIVAMAKNLAIGKDGKLPWHYAADLKFFKETTTGNTVVMGYNTWKSIGKPLPNRLNIILSRARDVPAEPNLVLLRSREEVLEMAHNLKGNVFIIGGAQVYKEFVDIIDEWIVTEIPQTVADADAFMFADFLQGFKPVKTRILEDGLAVKFYRRK
jgi:dihydrofolate reductase